MFHLSFVSILFFVSLIFFFQSVLLTWSFQTVEVEFGLYYGLLFQKLLLKTVADRREGK